MSSFEDSDFANKFLIKDKKNGSHYKNMDDSQSNKRNSNRKRLLASFNEKPRSNSLQTITEGFLKSDNENRNARILHRVKKQLPQPIEEQDERHKVTAFCFCDTLNLINAKKVFANDQYSTKVEGGVLYAYDNQTYCNIFIFPFGVIIFWNYYYGATQNTEINEHGLKDLNTYELQILKDLETHKAVNGQLDSKNWETDNMIFVVNDENKRSNIENNIIYIENDDFSEKFAHSYSLAHSVKLGIYENAVDMSIEATKSIPNELAEKGHVSVSKNDLGKMIGELFTLRSSQNLMSDLIDTPDYFWDHDEMEQIYILGKEQYDIEKRIDITNQRLDIIKEQYDMLTEEMHNKHSTRLEWIVIWLIIIEVIIEVVWNMIIKDILKLV